MTMKTDLPLLVAKRERARDDIAKARIRLKEAEKDIIEYIIDNKIKDFIKIDWAKAMEKCTK